MIRRPVVLATRRFPPAVEARLSRDYDVRRSEGEAPLTGPALIAASAGCDGLMLAPGTRLDADTIAALPATVRVAATFSVGTDHIDVAAAVARGLIVTNTPDVLTEATAEIAMLCLLGAARRSWEGQHMLRTGGWVGWTTTQLLGVSLVGRRLAIVGMGRIGSAVATRARAFGMVIHYHNRTRLPAEREAGAVYHASLPSLLAVADVLSLNAPGGAATTRLLDAAAIAQLPAGAIVVNTARGTLVDDDALIAALRSGRVRAAGLDVFTNEPALDPRYRELPNAYLLPHMGSATEETRDAMGFRCLDNLDAVFAGRHPLDRVM